MLTIRFLTRLLIEPVTNLDDKVRTRKIPIFYNCISLTAIETWANYYKNALFFGEMQMILPI